MKKKITKTQRVLTKRKLKRKNEDTRSVVVEGGLTPDTLNTVSNSNASPTPVEVTALPSETVVSPVISEPVELLTKSETVADTSEQKLMEKASLEVEEEVPMEKKNIRIYWMGVLVVVTTLILTVVVFVVKIQTQSSETTSKNLTQEEVKPEAVPTLKLVMNKGGINVEVLNGSGVRGLAGKMAKELVGLGYGEITTGNADGTSKSRIIIKSDKISDVELLKEDLKKLLGLEVEVENGLTGEADVQVILGSDAKSL